MKAIPKFNINDEVFILYNNKVCTGNIFTISVKETERRIIISYDIKISPSFSVNREENKTFETKEELLQSL